MKFFFHALESSVPGHGPTLKNGIQKGLSVTSQRLLVLAFAAFIVTITGVAIFVAPKWIGEERKAIAGSDAAGLDVMTTRNPDQSVKEILADGVVTFEEYKTAVNNTMACLDEHGVGHTEPVYSESRKQYSYITWVARSEESSGPGVEDACSMKFERDVQAAWVFANEGKGVGDAVDKEGALKCAAESGLNVQTFADLQSLIIQHPQDSVIQHCFVIGLHGFDPSKRIP